MSKFSKIALSVFVATVALSSAASAQLFTGIITSERATVIDHRDMGPTRRNEVVPARRGVDPSTLTDDNISTGPILPPSNGGFNPIGDISCFDGQVILYQEDYDVYFSDCSKYIYNYRAMSGNVIVDVFMSSFDGQYTTKIVGIVR
ncbi:MAG: hypothetical protein L3J21_03940 [Devosiaceae bacterium]|nr:hypothetical protein [Devosiaceae bacterium]